jgi:hypothetical protein
MSGGGKVAAAREIHLSYHDGEHYNSVRPLRRAGVRDSSSGGAGSIRSMGSGEGGSGEGEAEETGDGGVRSGVEALTEGMASASLSAEGVGERSSDGAAGSPSRSSGATLADGGLVPVVHEEAEVDSPSRPSSSSHSRRDGGKEAKENGKEAKVTCHAATHGGPRPPSRLVSSRIVSSHPVCHVAGACEAAAQGGEAATEGGEAQGGGGGGGRRRRGRARGCRGNERAARARTQRHRSMRGVQPRSVREDQLASARASVPNCVLSILREVTRSHPPAALRAPQYSKRAGVSWRVLALTWPT